MVIEFKRLDAQEEIAEFDCGNDDLNDFFLRDWKEGCNQLISVTYSASKDGEIVGYFCVSNDAIRKKDITVRGNRRRLLSRLARNKQYNSLPAVKIGRFATVKGLQRNGIGTEILDIIKFLFIDRNKTGCRFIIVDALNDEKILKFYQKNDFSFLIEDESEDTRLMFFDLLTFQQNNIVTQI